MDTRTNPLTNCPELSVPTPRPARYTFLTQFVRLLLLILLVGGTVTIGTFATRNISELKTLRINGRQMPATITDKHEYNGQPSSYYLYYAFRAGHAYVAGYKEVSLSEYNDTHIGSSLAVTYLPTNPATYRLGAVTETLVAGQSKVWEIAVLNYMVFIGLVFGFMEIRYRGRLALLRDGQVTVGRVIDRNIVRNKNTVYYIKYEFEISGQIISRKVPVSKRLYDASPEGQNLTILYDPTNAKKNLPYAVLNDVILEK